MVGQMASFTTNNVNSITWNHGKIVNVDSSVVIVGGENLWASNYLSENPVMDVMLQVRGNNSQATRYVNKKFSDLKKKDHPLNIFHPTKGFDSALDVTLSELDNGYLWSKGTVKNIEDVNNFEKYGNVPTITDDQVHKFKDEDTDEFIPVAVLPIAKISSVSNMNASVAARYQAFVMLVIEYISLNNH